MSEAKRDQGERRKPLREVVAEIDQDILRLLIRRHNLLEKMGKKGRLDSSEEKFLRESWQNEVAAVSRDPDLSGRFFALMQQISFMPRPKGSPETAVQNPPKRREPFNLAPAQKPVRIEMSLPYSWFSTCCWIYLAAAAGQPMQLRNCLQNDTIVDCIRGLVQMGGAITREDDAIIVREHSPLQTPDKVIFAGENEFVFYLFVCHYLGQHSRVKITGGTELQLADLSALGGMVAALGGRLVHIMPHSAGLPVRLESSGILPPGFEADPETPAAFLEALLLAAPFYPAPFAVALGRHPQKADILAHILPLLEESGATCVLNGDTVSISPGELAIPATPELPAEPELAAFILSFASVLGGEVRLKGKWPNWPEVSLMWQMCQMAGWTREGGRMSCQLEKPLDSFVPDGDRLLSLPWQFPLLASLASCATLHGGQGRILPHMLEDASTQDFLRVIGLGSDENSCLRKEGEGAKIAWNAPSASWALAYALTACCRPGKEGWPLGNPGSITALWPPFWQFYNSLPCARTRQDRPPAIEPPKKGRRIHTQSIAVLPEIRDED